MLTQVYNPHLPLEGFIADWIDGMAGQVSVLDVIVFGQDNDLAGLPANVQVHSLRFGFKPVRLLEVWWLMWQLHRRQPVDFVFNHMYQFMGVIGGLWAWGFGVKSLMWFAGGFALKRWSFVEAALRLNQIILTCSEQEKQRYINAYNLPPNKIHNLGHALSVKRFKPSRAINRKKDSIYRIGYVARCTPQKRVEVLIKAYGQAQLKTKADLQLVLLRTEENPAYWQQLQDLISNTKTSVKKITVIKGLEYSQMAEYYHQLDLYVHVSAMNSVDKAGIEAIFAKTPVSLSTIGYQEITRMFPDSICDPDDLQTVKKVLADPPAYSPKLYHFAREHYSIAAFTQKVNQIINPNCNSRC